MNIAKSFEDAFKRKISKNWEKIYVAVDIHDTIIRACYDDEETYDYVPLAQEALQVLSQRQDVCLILWTACYDEPLETYLQKFKEDGILFQYANENPEVKNTAISNFNAKWYFNVGIDDKFGFEADKDWQTVLDVLEQY